MMVETEGMERGDLPLKPKTGAITMTDRNATDYSRSDYSGL